MFGQYCMGSILLQSFQPDFDLQRAEERMAKYAWLSCYQHRWTCIVFDSEGIGYQAIIASIQLCATPDPSHDHAWPIVRLLLDWLKANVRHGSWIQGLLVVPSIILHWLAKMIQMGPYGRKAAASHPWQTCSVQAWWHGSVAKWHGTGFFNQFQSFNNQNLVLARFGGAVPLCLAHTQTFQMSLWGAEWSMTEMVLIWPFGPSRPFTAAEQGRCVTAHHGQAPDSS